MGQSTIGVGEVDSYRRQTHLCMLQYGYSPFLVGISDTFPPRLSQPSLLSSQVSYPAHDRER